MDPLAITGIIAGVVSVILGVFAIVASYKLADSAKTDAHRAEVEQQKTAAAAAQLVKDNQAVLTRIDQQFQEHRRSTLLLLERAISHLMGDRVAEDVNEAIQDLSQRLRESDDTVTDLQHQLREVVDMAIARDRELRSSVNEAVRGPTTRPYETLLRTLRILRSHEPVTTEDLSDHLGTSTQVAQAFMDSLNRYSEQFAEQGEDGRWSLTPSGRSLLVLEHEESIANIHSLLESLSVD